MILVYLSALQFCKILVNIFNVAHVGLLLENSVLFGSIKEIFMDLVQFGSI